MDFGSRVFFAVYYRCAVVFFEFVLGAEGFLGDVSGFLDEGKVDVVG